MPGKDPALEEVYQSLKKLAKDLNIVMVTPQQAPRLEPTYWRPRTKPFPECFRSDVVIIDYLTMLPKS